MRLIRVFDDVFVTWSTSSLLYLCVGMGSNRVVDMYERTEHLLVLYVAGVFFVIKTVGAQRFTD